MRKPEYIGTLPNGDWKFCLVVIKGQADVLVCADLTGINTPRMIVDGKLVTIKPQ